MTAYRVPFATQSARVFFRVFFACTKAVLVALVLIVAVLVAGQSTVAPISMRLLTTYAMEYAVEVLKPYRGFFPEPYVVEIDHE